MKELMMHLIVGFPSLQENEKLIASMIKNGVTRIELQIPFSDPLADGPLITWACHQSLANKTKVAEVFLLAGKFTRIHPEIKFYIVSYYNLIFNFGVSKFIQKTKEAGISGIICPDLPFDSVDGKFFNKECQKSKVANIFVISENIERKRLSEILKVAEDFIYITQVLGTTGVRKMLNPKMPKFLKLIDRQSKIKKAIGFGISDAKQVKQIHEIADIAVIGSALIKMYQEDRNISEIGSFINKLQITKLK